MDVSHKFYGNQFADGFAMKRQLKQTLLTLSLVLPFACSALAAERPTMKDTRDPRPDILAHPIYDAHVPYRRTYNRPRYVTGWIASKIAPTSQEALVWSENLRAGRYEERNMPPMYKRYFAPKPWEVLVTGARPANPSAAVSPVLPEITDYSVVETQELDLDSSRKSPSDR